MSERQLNILAAVTLLVSCSLENPCPEGTMRSNTSCLSAHTREDSSVDALDGAVDSGGYEVGDADLDAGGQEEAFEDGDLVEEDGSNDAEPAPGVDADADAPAGVCADETRDAWRRFQLSEDVVSTISACYETRCRTGDCDVSGCVKSGAQVAGCDRCIAAEISCAAEHCPIPCGVATGDDACRACACANRCLNTPAGCGVGSVDACTDCVGASCSARLSATTDTITIPIFFHLLHDRVDPTTGIPAYAVSASDQETILDIDARLVEANSSLDAARSDGRRLRLIRVGVTYVSAPNACPDPVTATDAQRFFGALNVVLTAGTSSCVAAATSAFAARASGATLLRTIGNMLGIAPADQHGDPWQITHEQVVRMHNYARWRLGAADAVPPAEREASSGFQFAPQDPIWDKPTNRDVSLTNASVFDATVARPFSSLPAVEEFVVRPTGAARRVLGVRVSAKFEGVPSENLHVVVDSHENPRRRTIATVPRSAMRVGDGVLVVEEAFDTATNPTWHYLRRRYAPGRWTVSIDDTADLTISEIRLEIVLGDRFFDNYDRHARGVADIMVYRPSTSELLTAMSPGDGSRNFGAVVHDPVPSLPDPGAEIMVGDVDGDGTVDLLARRGATIWVSFNKRGFGVWRAGSVGGNDRPTATDDVRLGDFDGDGFGDLLRRRSDLAAKQSRWAYHRGVGDGTFEAARVPVMPGDPYPVDMRFTVADWDGRGRTTLLLRYAREPYVVCTHNDTPQPTTSGATPVFSSYWTSAVGDSREAFFSSEQIVVLDVTQDGSDDLVVRRPGSGEWFVAINGGIELFTAMQPLTIGGRTTAFNESDVLVGAAPP